MPDESLPEDLCRRAGELIARQTGLYFPPERHADLQRALAAAAAEFGFAGSTECAQWLLRAALTPTQLNTLASHLTVGETYFFREQPAFEALSRHILPELVQQRRAREQRLRLWSAACCTGEEAYSLAILIEQLLGPTPDWNITILATDINERFLQRAVAGIYSEWSFRNAPSGLKERYFIPVTGGRWMVRPEIKSRVRFRYLNLAQDVFPSLETDTLAMDIVFCRNVLMYFTPSQAKQVITRLRRTLVEGGTLVMGATECSHTLLPEFRAEMLCGSTIYRKAEPQPRAPALPVISCEPPVAAVLEEALPTPEAPAVGEPQLLPARARDLANEGRFADALSYTERWIATDKTNFAAHYLHAMIHQEMGNLEAARHSLKRTLYLEPDFALAHFALGNLARATLREVEAERHFRNALRVLHRLQPDELLPETDGLTAGRLMQVINSLLTLFTPERIPT